MVFSSIPAYLDPSNWHQQLPNHQSGASSANPHQLPPQPQHASPPPPAQPHGGVGGSGGAGSIRPGSMTERARIANIPMPEGPQKCPRCESTNTKFCYFNNYSLSQPRHFCKTCRRYWTRGGALRSVPVGGGCRRNKRSKSTSSRSPASSDHRQTTSSSTGTVSSNSGTAANLLGLTSHHLPPLRFMSPLGQLSDHYNHSGEIGLNNYTGLSAPLGGTSEMNFQMGANFLGSGGPGGGAGVLGGGAGGGGGGGGGGIASLLSSGGIEQWRMQQAQHQFPNFLSGLDPSSQGLYQFPGGVEQQQQSGFVGEASNHHQVRPKFSDSMLTQMASVKMENNQEMNLARQFLGIPGNDHQWNNNNNNNNNNSNNNNNNNTAWTDLSSFSSSSTSNPL